MTDAGTPALKARLAMLTQARIGLGRVGAGLPNRAMLDFQMAHALARDAVHAGLDTQRLLDGLSPGAIVVSSAAGDRPTYLQRPDLGRRLDSPSADRLAAIAADGPFDLAIIVADGLSSMAVMAHAAMVANALRAQLPQWSIAPDIVAHQGRVALGDDIGARIGARMVVVLIGERPGLSAFDSLGAYITWQPALERRDSERNCVSNIRPPHGLSHQEAAGKIAWLLRRARALQLTGIALKDEQSGDKLTALPEDAS